MILMMIADRLLRLCVLALPIAAAGSLCAQSGSPQSHIPGAPPLLERVDPTIADISPLSESLREVNMQADLRLPTGFQNVYRVPGRADLLMRASGGIYAIFPQSAYVPTEKGDMAAIVPPGTVFSIGMPGPWMYASRWVAGPTMVSLDGTNSSPAPVAPPSKRMPWAGSIPVNDRHDARLGGYASTGEWTADGAPLLTGDSSDDDSPNDLQITRATPPDPSTFLKTVVTDDAYRATRLAALLERAANAARGDN